MLKIFGGSYQIDRALEQNEEQVMDLVEFLQSQKIQAATALFHDMFINGDSGTNASEFDGLDKLITGSGTDYTPVRPSPGTGPGAGCHLRFASEPLPFQGNATLWRRLAGPVASAGSR